MKRVGLQLLRGRLEGLRAVVGLLLEGHLGVGEDCRRDRAWRELRRVLHPLRQNGGAVVAMRQEAAATSLPPTTPREAEEAAEAEAAVECSVLSA